MSEGGAVKTKEEEDAELLPADAAAHAHQSRRSV